jgi:glucose-6-phosphate 1-dehydrogenase
MSAIKPCIIVIFGATGDLTNRKLLPALYKLETERMLHPESRIVAFARKEKTDEVYRKEAFKSINDFSRFKPKEKYWKLFSKKLYYHRAEFQEIIGFRNLRKLIKKICSKNSSKCNKIFYLAASHTYFGLIVNNLMKSGLIKSDGGFSRVIFEKPFGYNLDSAKKLNKVIKNAFSEDQIYRIDHYLGKELVQNLLVLRFANTIFDPIWNKKYIDHVQITVSEDIGVGSRGSYYDKSGALRDMVQNHMMQLVSLTAMEPPVSLDAEDVREEKVKVLRSIRPIDKKNVDAYAVRGQYIAGKINKDGVIGYKQEEKVEKNSSTETFVALKLNIDNIRWSGVPFYLRTGKRLHEKAAEIAVVFKKSSNKLFHEHFTGIDPNILIIRIQPEEGISLQFSSKIPGKKMALDNVRMDFCHECRFGPNTPEAYERLIYNTMIGDQTLFTRWDETEHAWRIIDSISNVWKKKKKIPKYKAGCWGPHEAEKLINKDGRTWYIPQKPAYSALLQR